MTSAELTAIEPHNPHFARLGGDDAVRRLVDSFYHNMDTLPEAATIRALHGEDLAEVKAVLRLYLTEWLGGPKDYSARRGPPRLRARHAAFPIGTAERDAWMLCMRAALKEIVVDDELRRQLDSSFLRIGNAIVNRGT